MSETRIQYYHHIHTISAFHIKFYYLLNQKLYVNQYLHIQLVCYYQYAYAIVIIKLKVRFHKNDFYQNPIGESGLDHNYINTYKEHHGHVFKLSLIKLLRLIWVYNYSFLYDYQI